MIAKNPRAPAFYCRYMPGSYPNTARYIIPATSEPLPDEIRLAFLRRVRTVLATGESAEVRLKSAGKAWDVEIRFHREGTVGTFWRLVSA